MERREYNFNVPHVILFDLMSQPNLFTIIKTFLFLLLIVQSSIVSHDVTMMGVSVFFFFNLLPLEAGQRMSSGGSLVQERLSIFDAAILEKSCATLPAGQELHPK